MARGYVLQCASGREQEHEQRQEREQEQEQQQQQEQEQQPEEARTRTRTRLGQGHWSVRSTYSDDVFDDVCDVLMHCDDLCDV